MQQTYQPILSSSCVHLMDVPSVIDVHGFSVHVPDSFQELSPFKMLDSAGEVVDACYLHPVVGYLLNSGRFDEAHVAAFKQAFEALEGIDQEIARVVKDKGLRNRTQSGYMAFSQANENVPEDSVLIDQVTYGALCRADPRWRQCRTVYVVRFPNLGPRTTVELSLLVDSEPRKTGFSLRSVARIAPELAALLDEIGEEQVPRSPMGCIYLHPSVLKDCLEGDGDGDLVFACLGRPGRPAFDQVSLTRAPARICPDHVAALRDKASRIDRPTLEEYLPKYIDDLPIGPATYAIRLRTFEESKPFREEAQPLHFGWERTKQWAIDTMETTFDRRKDEDDGTAWKRALADIETYSKLIKQKKKEGDWFCLTVTNSGFGPVDQFIEQFPTVQSFVDYVCCKRDAEPAKVPNQPERSELEEIYE